MHLNKISRHFPVFFFLIIFAVPIFCLLRGPSPNQWSLIERRELVSFPMISFEDFKSGMRKILQLKLVEADKVFFKHFTRRSFQTQFEKAASDQFPYRFSAIQTAKAAERAVISLAYAGLPDEPIPTDMTSGKLFLRNDVIIIDPVFEYNPIDKSLIDERIENYRNTINEYPDIHLYAFYLEQLNCSPFHPLDRYVWNADRGQGFDYFMKNKPDALQMETLPINSILDYEHNFYATDHHWNIHAALQGYDQIYGMLSGNYPEMSAPLKHDHFFTFPGVKYWGSKARASYYPAEGDFFEVANIDLLPYTLLVNGEDIPYDSRNEYLAGDYSTEMYEEHYMNVFGPQKRYLEYTFENGSDRNLLIFGTSYVRPIQAMLASHYHHTYIVFLKTSKNFSLSEFLSQHSVQDILVIGTYKEIYLDKLFLIKP